MNNAKSPKPVSRVRAHLKKHKEYPEMPPLSCDYSLHLCRLFFDEIQPSVEGEQGLTPLKWQEIDAWVNRTKISLSPGESLLIRNLSRDYVSQYSLSSDPACNAPWAPATIDRDKVGDDIDAFFDRLEAAQQKQHKASGAGDGIRRR